MPTRYTIEVAVETPDDARIAEAGGADRVELSAALDLGGLTPSVGLFEEVRASTRLPVVVMIRPRPGDFVYSDDEFRIMARDIEVYRPAAPAGFVFGALTADATSNTISLVGFVLWLAWILGVSHRMYDRAPRSQVVRQATAAPEPLGRGRT